VTFIHSLPDGIQAVSGDWRLRARRDRPGDFFVLEVGEAMFVAEAGEFFGALALGRWGVVIF
jgi:hypothetical protein